MKKRFSLAVNFNDPGDEQDAVETPATPQDAPADGATEALPAAD